jgi:putative superfamily III holin-X
MAVPIRETGVAGRNAGLDGETTLGLLRRLMDELAMLFRQEMALATAEISRTLGKLTAGLVSMVTGAAVLFAGFLVLLAAGVLALSLVVAPWLAALIVGAAVTLIGLVMVLMGRKAVGPAALELRHSPESLRKDKEVLTRSTS